MSIKSLIKGETIKIDNHHQGQEISINDEGLHLHKRYNAKTRNKGSAEVIIPLTNGKIEVRKGENPSNIIKEINRAFSDVKVRKEFIESVREALHDLAVGGSKFSEIDEKGRKNITDEGKGIINNAIVKVADFFGARRENIKELLYPTSDQTIASFRTHFNFEIYKNDETDWKYPRPLYIKADIKDLSFTVSEARYMVEMPFDEK